MGCTSSAPNTADIQTKTEDAGANRNLKIEEEKVNKTPKHTKISDLKSNKVEVLPTCDNLDETIQLPRNNSLDIVSNQQVEIVDEQNEITKHVDMAFSTVETQNIENKFTTLKEVVDHVILENVLADIPNMASDPVDKIIVQEKTKPDKMEQKLEFKQQEIDGDWKENVKEEIEEISEESASPCQSECSRSTRWEALADIAAELPASLAVDPLTGQIYSLAK